MSNSKVDTIKKRIDIFEMLAKTGKCNHKQVNISPSNLYKFVNQWKAIGLIDVERSGRELEITLTKKGSKYLESLTLFRSYSDFFL